MKQFNVRDETHALGRKLSYETDKSLIDVVSEAMEMYEESLEATDTEQRDEDRMIDNVLQQIADKLEVVLCSSMRAEIAAGVLDATRLMLAERAKESTRLAQLLRKSEDLPEMSHEEAYGTDTDSAGVDTDVDDVADLRD